MSTDRPSAIEIGMPVAIRASSIANSSAARIDCDSSMMSKRASTQTSASAIGTTTISHAMTTPVRGRGAMVSE